MKIKSVEIENVGKIEDTVIEFDKPLILFYGEIRAGKTTILNAIKWGLGASFPSDIIRHGEASASVTINLDCGSISRSWYVGRDGTTKARAITFVRDGEEVQRPDSVIKKMLNPFLLDNHHLLDMSESERRKFFVNLFDTDTSEADEEIRSMEAEAKDLRATIKAYGEVKPTKAERVDVEDLKAKREEICRAHAEEVEKVREEVKKVVAEHRDACRHVEHQNAKADDRDRDIANRKSERVEAVETIGDLKGRLLRAEERLSNLDAWLEEHPPLERAELPKEPDTSRLDEAITSSPDTREVDSLIRNAAEQNVRADEYERDMERKKELDGHKDELKKVEGAIRSNRKKREAALAEAAKSVGIEGLEFDKTGSVVFEGTTAGMLSTSQIMRLSSALSALYPEGFNVELIDRAESLGKSIFGFIDRAKAEEKTILASIVGEKPAEIPDEVGVFVVDDGVVTSADDGEQEDA